jgi:hypothetical protein
LCSVDLVEQGGHIGDSSMLADRRQVMLSLFAATAFGRPDWASADEDRALFWRIKTRDNRSGIIFGYGRIAASLAPDIVEDGERVVEQTSRVVLDMNSFNFPPANVGKQPPLLPRLSPAVAAELRQVLGDKAGPLETATGFFVGFLLMAEGQISATPSVGDVIINRAIALRRPITALLSEDEVKHLARPVDWAALNEAVDEKMITFLLDLRKQVGPIGTHSDTLYRTRKSAELYRFSASLAEHGVPGSELLTFTDNYDLLFSRMSAALTTAPCCVFAPVGLLTGPDGILERLRRQGAEVSVFA